MVTIMAQDPADHLDVDQEPTVLGMIVGRLNDLAEQIRHLDRKTDARFDGLDDKLDTVVESTSHRLESLESGANKRLTALETDEKVKRALGERRVRASDRKRHWLMTGIGVAATVGGGGLAVLIQHAVGG